MDSRCRLCLTFSLENVDLFVNEAKYISVKEIVEKLTGIKMYECKELPSSICISCMDLIDVIINFKSKILSTEKILQNEKKIITSPASLKSEISSDVDQNNDIFCEEIKVEDNEWDYEPPTQYLSSELLEEGNLDEKEDIKSLKPKIVNKREKTKTNDKKMCRKSKKSIVETHDNITYEEDNCNHESTTDIESELPKQENASDKQIDDELSKPRKSNRKKPRVKNSKTKQKRNTDSNEDTLSSKSTEKAWRKYKASYEVSCHFCGKMVSKFVMENHLNMHTGLRPYKCDVENCNKTFAFPSGLRTHKLTHSNAERFKCKECGKGFKLSHVFKQHMTYHYDPQLPCSICGKLYRNQQTLRLHIRRHKNERNYKCDQCEGAFITSSLLKRHIMTHTGVKPYKCEFCGKDFRYKQMLDTHCKKYH